ncbi:protein IQ-DOMAIN 32-like [Bidens hawaiensis]|uniref:protein IQ-DOMAIN 32-like n=1 Tax=Bidens hawaiensis TaxID=980011 RepID=UPI00404ACAE9
MGRSTPSCFKIIACGGGSNESVDPDEIDASSENKGPDKRGWSFRKRSARHRVLSNTVVADKLTSSEDKPISEPITISSDKLTSSETKPISEPITISSDKLTSSENKPISEPITISSDNLTTSESKPISISSEPQVYNNISEKTCDNIWTEEEIPDSVTKNAAVSTVAIESACEEDDVKSEPVPDGSDSESAVLVIQAAVRRFLAEKELVKHKNVVKLQAAVRGHLVRNHAVGTLRCVQAIVKMQALVRARKGVQNAGVNSNPTYVSIEKLLSNRLARQLLESTPKGKQINIKCEPLKSDSAWNWLERWMFVSSPDVLESRVAEHDNGKVVNNTEHEVKTVVTTDVAELILPVEENKNLIHINESSNEKTREEEKPVTESMELHTAPQIEVNSVPEPILENIVSETKPEPIPENPVSETKPEPVHKNPISETKPEPVHENPISETKPEPLFENPVSETKPKPIPENLVSETEPKRSAKRVATDQPDSEGRKSIFGSRKASNPAFIAAQSRFEELTSLTKPLKPTNSSNQDDVAGSSGPLKSPNSVTQDDVAGSVVDIVSSEPEKLTPAPDVEPDEHVVTHGSIAVQNGGSECGTELSITSTLDSPDHIEVENKKPEEPKASNEAVDDYNNNINNNNNNIDIGMPEIQVDQEVNDTDIKPEAEPESSHHEPGPQISTTGSPTSHITIPESQGTPSSQVSTNTKKSKTDKKSTSQKRKSWSTSKKSSADSGPRTSLEQLPKDPKPGKRRNSFGSPKPENSDQETSVPSYMQATESARAKAIASASPSLSPDGHDKETYLKKRHSLPGAVNGRQGSPRIQRSMSQALQTTKGNVNQERKWQR